ncbi:S9 family peptidase [Thalassotalea mangrovi]|uniref:S9 family peptidase n=1 Tax=Thalassotalea mangrovi TaxID=2572245 RepID=A0A4U1B5H0_9GAMM|nr:S9 family peptidase [Thalassotalea mangrovi]TKB45599.1 S9 family peptidase [Thalassotalea mangrovi]
MGYFSRAKTTVFSGLAIVSLGLSAMASANDALLDFQDVFNIEYVGSIAAHPNKDYVIYERRSLDIMADSTRSNLWQIEADGSNHRPVLSGKTNYRMPVFSPDGARLAYVSSAEGDNQLYMRWLDTGQTARVSNLSHSPQSVSFSPDGKWLAFVMFTPAKPSNLNINMPKKPKGAKWAGNATYIDSLAYRSDGAGFLPSGFNHIYVVPSEGGSARQITQGDFHHDGQLSWTADSQHIVFSSDRHEDWQRRPLESDIYRVNVKTGEITTLLQRQGPEFAPVISPKGDRIAFLQIDDRKLASQNAQLYVMNSDGSNVKGLVTKLDRPLGNVQWDRAGDGLYFSYDDHGKKKLGYVNLGGKISRLDAELGGQSLGRPYTSGNYVVGNNDKLFYTLAKTQRPADLASLSKGGATKQLTQLNLDALGSKELAKVRSLTVKSSVDERPVEAWLALPPDFDPDKKYPLILEIHGGPHAAYGPQFSLEVQLMAAKGYVVVWANPRGSTSYGEEFANLIHHNYPSEDYNDLMDVVDGVIEEGYVDESQLYVTGGSGGGTLTAWIIGKTDRFKAAVVAKPVINWLSFSLTADGYAYFTQYWMPGMPWEQVDHLWKHSPLSLVGNVSTPTMLLTGEEDYRTPMSETEQYYQALQLRNIDSAMVRIPKASHGIAARPSNLIQKIGYILAWFDKYKPETE